MGADGYWVFPELKGALPRCPVPGNNTPRNDGQASHIAGLNRLGGGLARLDHPCGEMVAPRLGIRIVARGIVQVPTPNHPVAMRGSQVPGIFLSGLASLLPDDVVVVLTPAVMAMVDRDTGSLQGHYQQCQPYPQTPKGAGTGCVVIGASMHS